MPFTTPTFATRCKYIGIYVYISICPHVCTCVYLHICVLDEVWLKCCTCLFICMNLFYILNQKHILLHLYSRRMVAYIPVCVVLLVDVCEYYCVCLCASARAIFCEFFCESQCFVAKILPTYLSCASATWLVHWVCCFDYFVRNRLVALLEDVFVEQVIARISTKSLHALNKSFHAFRAFQHIVMTDMIKSFHAYQSTNRSIWRLLNKSLHAYQQSHSTHSTHVNR